LHHNAAGFFSPQEIEMTGTILDAHMAQHPPRFWKRMQKPTALQLAIAALEECRREGLEQAQKSEYHKAMVVMLKERDKRLVDEIKRLSKKPQDSMLED
jgi:hypothetical protein